MEPKPPIGNKPHSFHYIPFAVDAAYLSDRGHVRPRNEDAACVIKPEDPAILHRKGVLMVVADGMGGHEGGELASRMAVDILSNAYYQSDLDPHTALTVALHQANRDILRHTKLHPEFTGMGTTCTAIAVINGCVWLAHVGDTRLYLIRDGHAYRMTQDHSVPMDMVNRGLMTVAEADRHPERNILLRAVGTRDKVEATTWKNPFPVWPGDRLLICSDGFYEIVSDEEIGRLCSKATASAPACETLLHAALQGDGSDNITVAVLFVMEGNP